MKKNILLFLLILVLDHNIFSDNIKEYHLWLTRINIQNKTVLIFKDTEVYESVNNLKVINKINKYDEVIVIVKYSTNTYYDCCYSIKNQKPESFYKIKLKDGTIGYIRGSSFLYPYLMRNKNEIYGISEEILMNKQYKECFNKSYNDDKPFYVGHLFLNIIIKDKITKLNLTILKNPPRYEYYEPYYINISNENNDNIDEIILKGNYINNIFDGGHGFQENDVEYWYNFNNDDIFEIFKKPSSGVAAWGEWEYSLKKLKNEKGFINKIILIEKFKGTLPWEPKYFNENDIYINKKEFTWNGKKYQKNQDYYKPSVNGLNLREEPKLDSNKIRVLAPNDKIEIIYTIDKEVVIDNIRGNWVYVLTEKKELGFCFNGYLVKMQ